jgi:magnesium transporter
MRLNPTNISIIQRLLIGRVNRPLRAILARLKPSDVASLINLLKDSDRKRLVQAMGLNTHLLDVLGQLPESQLSELFDQMSPEWVSDLLHFAPESDGAYYLSQLSEEAREQALSQLDAPKRSKLLQYLNYPEDSAGRLMTESVFALPSTLSAEECIEEIRKRSHTESIYYVYCIDEFNRLVGVVSLRSLVTADKNTPLDQIARKDVITVKPETPSEDVANLVAKYDLVALPVVNDDHELIGIVGVDEVVDLVQEKATAMFYASAGLQEDDRVYTSWTRSLQRRLPWMVLNLALAGLASVVVSLFETTISELVVLAFLQNIVAATGGNSAIQTLTVVTRGLATDDFQFISLRKAVLKEALVGLCIGLVLGLLAAGAVYLWKGNVMVSTVLGLAMAINLPLASTVSSLIPVLVKRLNFDPAVSSGVIATMFTDIFGFFSFLGIATLAMKLLGAL